MGSDEQRAYTAACPLAPFFGYIEVVTCRFCWKEKSSFCKASLFLCVLCIAVLNAVVTCSSCRLLPGEACTHVPMHAADLCTSSEYTETAVTTGFFSKCIFSTVKSYARRARGQECKNDVFIKACLEACMPGIPSCKFLIKA